MDRLTCDSESRLIADAFEIDTFAKLCQRFKLDFILNFFSKRINETELICFEFSQLTEFIYINCLLSHESIF